MSLGTISWNPNGHLPPVIDTSPVGIERSPYTIEIDKFVQFFAYTNERILLLRSFIQFRQDMANAGVTAGFQWVDGSFVQNVENTESRSPNDIDVVTWSRIPPNTDQKALVNQFPSLFNPVQAKKNYNVDSYFINLALGQESLICKSTYWYSIWSHTRDLQWKGFINIPLNGSLDVKSIEFLDTLLIGGSK